MKKRVRSNSPVVMLLTAILLVCGATTLAFGGSGGSGGGGGTTTGSSVLPTTPPAPDVILRESFGLADLFRPTGGKGTLKEIFLHKPIASFWLEYPGSKDTAWLAPSEGQTWRFAASSDNPYEMPSPIQQTWGNGCVVSEWFDPPTQRPTALMPFKAPSTPYEVSINGYPAPLDGAYIAVGLTNSTLLDSNLETSASVWLLIKPLAQFDGFNLIYELRANGMTGPVLATGPAFNEAFNRLVLRYDPVTMTLTASVNEKALGSFALTIPRPRFIGFEGVGVVDNFVVRQLQ
jgi:hypothetical protein